MPTLLQLRLGTLAAADHRKALLPYDPRQPVALIHDERTATQAADLLEGLALQLLLKHPPGRARLVLFEGAPSRAFGQLKRLLAEAPALGEQVFNLRAFSERLAGLDELAHRRCALLAAAQCADLSAYNAAHAPEPFVYLILSGLGPGLGEAHQLHALRNLLLHGPEAGLTPLLLAAEPPAVGIGELWRTSVQGLLQILPGAAFGFDLRGGGVAPFAAAAPVWRVLSRFRPVLGLDEPLRRQWAERLLADRQAAEARSTQRDFLRIEIGRVGAHPQHFALGEAADAYHALIAGASRSGKSTLLNRLILEACEAFGPDALRLWLFDFREGVEFTLFAGLAHLDALHVDNADKGYAIAAFARFTGLMKERTALFLQCRPPVSKIEDYNRVAAVPLPRCLLIVDEAQSLFDDRETRPHANRFIKEVARKGAAYGLHLILCTQSYQEGHLEPDVKAQFHLRIGLHLSGSPECRALMGRDNEAMLNLPRGSAVYNNRFGEVEHNRIVALHDLPREELFGLSGNPVGYDILKLHDLTKNWRAPSSLTPRHLSKRWSY
ncbi:FtsK/SpoIIIE domain-containing protein [uncultured Thiodictyon sp.]|uniref:FtsK/SpoIIIE domain-containing protein n=1 Tax=uncultured Thiodictyon sp. TaxID=1846217 RepID=UPI0025D56033|nr:FtsK/SpoIIIE domain-containing protein [uncultured Thiodictyon sp.]